MQAKEIPMTYVFPTETPQNKLTELKRTITNIFNYLNIKHGEFNIEAYYNKNDVLFVIEINVRQGGNQLPNVIEDYCGIDFNKLLVSTAVGDLHYLNRLKDMKRSTKFITRHVVYSHNTGVLTGLYIDSKINKYIYRKKEIIQPGFGVNKSIDATKPIAIIDLVFDSREKQLSISNSLEEYIYPIVEMRKK